MMWKAAVFTGFGAAVLVAACGYPEIEYRDPSKGSNSSKQSSSVTSSVGGMGGMGGMGGAGGATVTTSTTTAGGNGPCDPFNAVSCPGNQKCSVIDEDTGSFGCVPAKSGPAFTACNTDNDCKATTWCDHTSGVCKPFCNDNKDCNLEPCLLALKADNMTPIPGVQLCVAPCSPLTGTPCDDPSAHCVPIVIVSNQTNYSLEWDCEVAGPGKEDAKCETIADCGFGLMCDDRDTPTFGKHCKPWCAEGDSCPTLQSCETMSVIVNEGQANEVKLDYIYETKKIGVCDV